MIKAYLLLGGNLGNRSLNLKQALDQIATKLGKLVKTSSVYETAAWGETEQSQFLNQVVEIDTKLSPAQLLERANNIEEDLGRTRLRKWEARLIDIDILFYGDMVMRSDKLSIPHPELQNRRFTLVPLAEIAPDLEHPVFQLKIRELLEKCPDKLEVKRYNPEQEKSV